MVGGGEEGAATEGEDHRIGVQRAQAPVAEPRDAVGEIGPGELGGDQHADRHADHAPQHGGEGEVADWHVVVAGRGER